MSLFLVSACANKETQAPVTRVEVRTVEVKKPAPIVPSVDTVNMRPVTWMVITPDNAEQKLNSISGDPVVYALTAEGYKNISLNLSDLRASFEQFQRVIRVYQSQYK